MSSEDQVACRFEGLDPEPLWTYGARMDVGVLGPLRVADDAGELRLPGTKERILLARLAARVDQVVVPDELVDALWPIAPPRTAIRTLQVYVARLRSSLARDDGPGDAVIVTAGRGYRLAIDPMSIDANRFRSLVELGRSALAEGHASAAVDTFTEALGLWRGPAYCGFEESAFARSESRRLDELRMTAQEGVWAARTAAGDARGAIPELEAHVTTHPLREPGWALLVRAHAAAEDQAAALATIDRARDVLAEELGVDPGEELRTLHARVLAQDPALRPRVALPPELVGPGTPLVGRAGGLAVLGEHLRQARGGSGHRVLVIGEPGSGRWRLASALAQTAQSEGARVVVGAQPADGVVLRVIDLRADRSMALPQPGPQELQLVVAGVEPPGVAFDARVEVGPLQVPDVREVLAGHARGGVDEGLLTAAAEHVHAASGGNAAAVQRLAIAWARDQVSARVAQRAQVGSGSAAAHTADRLALAEDVELWSTLAPAPVAGRASCPWRGLASYAEADAAWFSGRERLTAELVARVAVDRALLLVGASGSGKSSLVRAGLLASLAAGALPGSAGWVRIVMRPGEHPMRGLTRAALSGAAATGPDRVADLLSRSLDGRGGADRVLLVVDQFEETWTVCNDPGERDAFLDALVEVARAEMPVSVVIAVRADHAGSIAGHPGISDALAGQAVFVGPMVEGELRRAIEGPAARAGLNLDIGLADALVTDTLAEPGGLPLLSTALTALWEQRSGARLTLASYATSGGVGAAIAHLAEQAYADLDDGHRDAARILLRRLAGPGQGEGIVRRRVALAELDALPDPRVRACVDPLAAARLLTVSDGHVEVAHEALFRSWPRLRDWLAEDASARDVLRRLTSAATDWERDERDPALLWSGARLSAAADLVARAPGELTGTEVAFVEASTARLDAERVQAEDRARTAQRQNTRLRRVLAGLGITLAIALVAGGLAVVSRNEAAAQSRTATAHRLAAAAASEDYITERMLTAVEAVRTEESPQTVGALLSMLDANAAVIDRIDTQDRLLGADAAPGSRFAVAAGRIEDLHWFDMATGAHRVIWSEPDASLMEPRVSPDERYVVFQNSSFSRQRPARLVVVEIESGREVWRRDIEPAPGAEGPFDFQALHWGWDFTDTPGQLAVALTDGVVLVDLDDPDGLRRLVDWDPVEPQLGRSFWLGDDRFVVLGGEKGSPARLVDLRARTATELPEVGSFGTASADGRWLLTQRAATAQEVANGQAPLRIIDLIQPGEPAVEVPFDGDIGDAGLTPDGRTAAVGSRSGDLVIIDLATGEVRETMTGAHNGPIMGVVVSPDGSTVWTEGHEGNLLAWDLTGLRRLAVGRDLPLALTSGSVAADGRVAQVWMANAWNEPSTVAVMDTASGELLVDEFPARGEWRLEGPNAFAGGITPDGSTLLVGWTTGIDDPARLRAVDVASGEVEFDTVLPWWPNGVDASPDAAFVAGAGGVARVDLASGAISAQRDLEPGAWSREVQSTVEVSPDGRQVAVSRDHEVMVLDAGTLETIAAWPLGDYESAHAMAWRPDGSGVAFGGDQGRVYVRSVLDGRDLIEPRLVFPAWVSEIAFSPDGALIALLGGDGAVVLIDTVTGEPIGKPLKQGLEVGRFGFVQFSDDGHALEVFSEFKRAYRYPIDTSLLIARACRIAAREPTRAEWTSMHGSVPQRPTCGDLASAELPAPPAPRER